MGNLNAWTDMMEALGNSVDCVHEGPLTDAFNDGIELAIEIVSRYKRQLTTTATHELVNELRKREDVVVKTFGTDESWRIEGDVPAVVLIITDSEEGCYA